MKDKPTMAYFTSEVRYNYLTPNKRYNIEGFWNTENTSCGYCFHIIDDEGHRLTCIEVGSSHLHGNNWTLE